MAQKSVVSIDIGSSKIKIAVGSFDKEKVYIEKAFMIDTPKGSYKDGRLLSADSAFSELGMVITKVLHDNKIKYKDAIITLQSTMIIKRELEIPKVKPKDMESMIKYEIEQYLPIDLSEYIIEYKQLEEINESKSRILIAALPREISDGYYNILNQMQLEPKALDLNSNSISKLLSRKLQINNLDYSTESTVALIDLGCNSINIIIFSKGYFQFSRLLPFGGCELDTAIADLYGIPETDAEKKKLLELDLNISSTEPGAMALNNTASEVVSRWIEDIQRVFQFYKTRNAQNEIDKIYLYGGTSNLKGIAGYFEKVTGVSTEKITALDNVVLENSLTTGYGIERFLNSIGAIIRR